MLSWALQSRATISQAVPNACPPMEIRPAAKSLTFSAAICNINVSDARAGTLSYSNGPQHSSYCSQLLSMRRP